MATTNWRMQGEAWHWQSTSMVSCAVRVDPYTSTSHCTWPICC